MIDSALIQKTTIASLNGTMTFPEVVGLLMAAGVESYQIDFRRKEKTLYMPNGESLVEQLQFEETPISMTFSAEGIKAAIKGAQTNQIKYKDFIAQAMQAGITHYDVYITGQKVIYFGRNGDMHIEPFPQRS